METIFISTLVLMFLGIFLTLFWEDIKNIKLSIKFYIKRKYSNPSLFPDYINWEAGDSLLYWENAFNVSKGRIQTFNNKEVIVMDSHKNKIVIVDFFQIEENETYKLRSSLKKSHEFHTQQIPELRECFGQPNENNPSNEATIAASMLEGIKTSKQKALQEYHDKRNN